MPSPFPGMDPWLERPALFPDLHDELISCLRAVLNRSLPAGYAALGSSLVWVDPTHHRERDLSVLGPFDRRDGEVVFGGGDGGRSGGTDRGTLVRYSRVTGKRGPKGF